MAGEVGREINNRLQFLVDVGLEYLTLARPAPSLSGGEMQRIRLAAQLGSGLCGVLYVLDEPTIGLHPRDNHRLLAALQKLRDLGNTLLVVEHDREVIGSADQLLDFGPAAGQSRRPDRRPRHARASRPAARLRHRAISFREEGDSGADESQGCRGEGRGERGEGRQKQRKSKEEGRSQFETGEMLEAVSLPLPSPLSPLPFPERLPRNRRRAAQ